MPTLLSVNSYFYRRDGAATVMFDHDRVFERNHWKVVPFAMHHPLNQTTVWSKYFVDEIEFDREYTVLEKIVRVPRVIYSLQARRRIAELIDQIAPDACHCHSIYHHLSPSILDALKSKRVPTVMTLHDLKIACPAYYMWNNHRVCEACRGHRVHNVLLNRCIKNSVALSGLIMIEALLHNWLQTYENCVDRFVSPSRFYITKLEEWGWDTTKFVHVPNSVDVETFRPVYAPGKFILYFGRLSPEKGLTTLIKAAGKSGVPLHIAGDGPEQANLRRAASQFGADVTFLGGLTFEALSSEIGRARACVLPSEWYENAPMTILESYAVGKPVIGANIGGIGELLQEGVTGRLFKSGSDEELAGILAEFMSMSDGAIADMGHAARRWVESDFSPETYFQRITEVYRTIGAL